MKRARVHLNPKLVCCAQLIEGSREAVQPGLKYLLSTSKLDSVPSFLSFFFSLGCGLAPNVLCSAHSARSVKQPLGKSFDLPCLLVGEVNPLHAVRREHQLRENLLALLRLLLHAFTLERSRERHQLA